MKTNILLMFGRWIGEMGSGRWQVAGGGWRVAGGKASDEGFRSDPPASLLASYLAARKGPKQLARGH